MGGNCVALAYVPYHLTYKFSGLSEYGAFWKCVTAGFIYMFTQLAKMLFLATFFPVVEDEDEDLNAEVPFEFVTEFLKLTVDLADLIGLYLVIQRVAGKGQVKVLCAGLGWAFAELVLTRIIFLWVGAPELSLTGNTFKTVLTLISTWSITLLWLLWFGYDSSGDSKRHRSSFSYCGLDVFLQILDFGLVSPQLFHRRMDCINV